MQSQPASLSPVRNKTILVMGIYVLVVMYLLNIFTPLRLHVDMLRYFAIKDCVELGCPPDSEAAKDYLPFGYTALLLFLSKIGLLKSWSIVLINCLYLFGSLYLIKKIMGASLPLLGFVGLVLLNWTTIKFVAHPLSEMQYIFFSIASIYFFFRYTQAKNFIHLGLAFVTGGIAFITRSVGVALAAALMLSLVWEYRRELLLLIRKNRIIVILLCILAIGVVIFSKQLGLNHYTGVFNKQFAEGVSFGEIIQWHFTEWTELGLNTSIAKWEPYLPPLVVKTGAVLLGIAFFIGVVYLVFFRKNNIPFIIKAYLGVYIILMFSWPFYDPRFWVPVLPLIVAAVVQVPASAVKNSVFHLPRYAMLFVYISLGLVSIGYLTYTSLNREVFARTQANGVYRNEYETVFYGKPLSDTAKNVNPVTVHVIERYNK